MHPFYQGGSDQQEREYLSFSKLKAYFVSLNF